MENPPEALDLNFIGHQKQLQAMHFYVIPKVFEVNEPIFHIFPLDLQHDWPSIPLAWSHGPRVFSFSGSSRRRAKSGKGLCSFAGPWFL